MLVICVIEQYFSNFSIIVNHLRELVKMQVMLQQVSFRFHLSSKLPGNAKAGGLCTKLWVTRSQKTKDICYQHELLFILLRLLICMREYLWYLIFFFPPSPPLCAREFLLSLPSSLQLYNPFRTFILNASPHVWKLGVLNGHKSHRVISDQNSGHTAHEAR